MTTPPCGTPAGYRQHRRRGELADQACKDAWTDYCRGGKPRVKGPKAGEVPVPLPAPKKRRRRRTPAETSLEQDLRFSQRQRELDRQLQREGLL